LGKFVEEVTVTVTVTVNLYIVHQVTKSTEPEKVRKNLHQVQAQVRKERPQVGITIYLRKIPNFGLERKSFQRIIHQRRRAAIVIVLPKIKTLIVNSEQAGYTDPVRRRKK